MAGPVGGTLAGIGQRWVRRDALRIGLTAGGAVAVGGALAACGPTGAVPPVAAPTKAASAKTTLVWRPWYNFSQATSKTGHDLLMEGIQPWLDQHPGVEIVISFLGYQQATVAALLAGNGPDIFADWVLHLFTGSGLLLDMSSYVKRDNVDLSIFPSFEIDLYSEGGGLWALPSYFHLQAPAVNLGILDQMGLTYPQPGWTHQQWADLWKATTLKTGDSKKRRVGGQFVWSGYNGAGSNPHAYYLKGFGGEYADAANRLHCTVDQQGSLDALTWTYDLLASGACDTGGADFASGHKTTGGMDTAGGLINAARGWNGVKWQLYDEPTYPKGRTAYVWSDFYAISAATKAPDLAWSFLQYLCVAQQWQRWMVKLALNGPNQKSLYTEWAQTVKAVAPPLTHIDLDVFTRQMQNNEPYFGVTFEYADTQSGLVINTDTAPAQKNLAELPTGARQATQQVDALQAASADMAGKQAGISKQFPTANGSIIAGVQPGL